ncbi:MAG: Crp/Fnr family transcriptional regulator [Bacteroidetes bacterium]|nr:MAG: Crp/Fnr family transcriptional regulator [Bacteroidota bacterium]
MNAFDKLNVLLSQVVPQQPMLEHILREHMKPQQYAKGDVLLSEGEISNSYLFLASGCIRAFLHDTEGNEVTINFFTPGEMVFEVNSFFQRIPSVEYWDCMSDCEVLYLNYEVLNHLFHAYPEFRDFGRAMLVRGFIRYKERTLSHINKTAEQRYKQLLETKAEVLRHAPLKHVASYLGVTDSSLSRIRREMSKS